jgi:hypothetical protein
LGMIVTSGRFPGPHEKINVSVRKTKAQVQSSLARNMLRPPRRLGLRMTLLFLPLCVHHRYTAHMATLVSPLMKLNWLDKVLG